MSTQETEKDVKSLVTPFQQTKLKEQQEQSSMSTKGEPVSAMKELDIIKKYLEAYIDSFSSGRLVLERSHEAIMIMKRLLHRTYPLLDHKGWMKNPSEEKWCQFPFVQLKDLERLPDSSIEVVKRMVWHALLINAIKNKTSATKRSTSIREEMHTLVIQDLEKESAEEVWKSLSEQPPIAKLSIEEGEGLYKMIAMEKEIRKRWIETPKELPHSYRTEPYFFGMVWMLLFVVKELKTLCQTRWLKESDLKIPYRKLSNFFQQCHYLLDHHDEFTEKFRESMEVVYKWLLSKCGIFPTSDELYERRTEQDVIREIEEKIAAIHDEVKSLRADSTCIVSSGDWLRGPPDGDDRVIPDEYLVVFSNDAIFKDEMKKFEDVMKQTTDTKIESKVIVLFESRKYAGFCGFAAKLDKTLLAEIEKKMPNIDHVDKGVYGRLEGIEEDDCESWGLIRTQVTGEKWREIKESALEGSCKYRYNDQSGKDIYVYVLDTGIRIFHEPGQVIQLSGAPVNFVRVDIPGHLDCTPPPFNLDQQISESDSDVLLNIGNIPTLGDYLAVENPNLLHATHVAGIIRSMHYGVSKKTTLVSINICDQEGRPKQFLAIKGLEIARRDHEQKDLNISIVNMSFSFDTLFVRNLDVSVKGAKEEGLLVVTCAGNVKDDEPQKNVRCLTPAGSEHSVTVAASDADDKFWDRSNYGEHVKYIAPGVGVTSILGSEYPLSGTSYACAYLSGVLACMLSDSENKYHGEEPRDKFIDKLLEKLDQNATEGGVVVGCELDNTPKRFLHYPCNTPHEEETVNPRVVQCNPTPTPILQQVTVGEHAESDSVPSLEGSLTNGSPTLNGTLPQSSSPSLSNTGKSKCLTATATTEE